MRTIGILLCVLTLSGCSSATPTYKQGTATMAQAYDMAYTNSSNQFDAYEKAAIASHTQRMDVELAVDLKSLSVQAQLNAPLWTPTAIAAETTRLQALHDKKIADYAAALANFRAIKQKNEQINLATAHTLRDALNPPALPVVTPTPATPVVDLSGVIQGATGAQPAGVIVTTPTTTPGK